jgi:serine/threonine protein phosphatase PrpC
MKIECYAASRPQQGRTANEDAFLIGRETPSFAGLCDGAGNAQQAAKRVLALFEKLFREASLQEVLAPDCWQRWVKLLDSSLLGGTQSTFLAVAVLDGNAVGTCVGDSRAYTLHRDGECRIVTEAAAKFRLGSGKAESFFVRQPLAPGDMLLMLSDGAWTPLSPYLLRKAVLAALPKGFAEVPSAILDAAGRTGRLDDMTAIAMRTTR